MFFSVANRWSLAPLAVIALSFAFPSGAEAANRYWVGSAGGNWSDAANWASADPASCTGGGAGVPGTSDVAIFDADCDNDATMNTTISVAGISIASGYAGTISPSSSISIAVGTSGFTQAGGTFTSTTGTFSIVGSFTNAGGTFNHNDGTIAYSLRYSTSPTIRATGTTFNNFTVDQTDFENNYQVILTLSGSLAVAGDVTIQNSGSSDDFTFRGSNGATLDIEGDLSFPSTPFNGFATIGSSSASLNLALNVAGNYSLLDSSVTMYANVTFDGTGNQTATATTGNNNSPSLMKVAKSSGTVFATTSLRAYRFNVTSGTFSATGGTLTATNVLSMSGGTFVGGPYGVAASAFVQTGGAFTAPSDTFTLNGGFTRDGGTFNHNDGTIAYDLRYPTSPTIRATGTTFNDFTVDQTDFENNYQVTLTLSGSLAVAGDVTIQNSGSSDDFIFRGSNGATLDIEGDLSFPSTPFNGFATIGSSSASLNLALNVAGDFSIEDSSVTFYANVTFDGTGNQNASVSAGTMNTPSTFMVNKASGTVFSSSALTAYRFNVTSGTFSATGGVLIVKNILSMSGGTFVGGSRPVTTAAFQQNGGAFTAPSLMTVSGGYITVTGGSFNSNSGTFIHDYYYYNGNAPVIRATGIQFYNLKLTQTDTDSGNNYNVLPSLSGSIVVANDLTVTTHSPSDDYTFRGSNSASIDVGGDFIVPADGNAGTIAFGSSSPSLNIALFVAGDYSLAEGGYTQYATVTLDGTGNQSVSKTAGNISGGAWTVNRSSEERGTAANLASALSLPSTLTISSGTFDASGHDLSCTSTFTVANGGTFRLLGNETVTTPTLNAGSSVVYDGGSIYTVKDWSYRNLSFSGTGIFNLGAAESIAENLTLSGATFDISGQNLTVTGTFYNDGKLRLQGGETTVSYTNDTDSGIVEYDGGSSYTGLKAGNNYYTLSFSGAGTWTLNASVDTNSGFTIPSPSATVSAGSNAITVGGNWLRRGTFTAGTSTVTLDGANQSMTGSTTFATLAKTVSSAARLTLGAGQTYVAGTALTLRGAASNLLSLRSSSSGSTYSLRLNGGGTQTIDYLDVQDSDASGGDELQCYTTTEGCVNAGNNTNWAFITAPNPPTILSPSDGSSGNDSTPTVSGTGSVATNTIRVYSGSTVLCTTTVNNDSAKTWSCASSTLSDGSHTLTAKEDDGNESNASNTVTITIDTVAPDAVDTPDLVAASDSGSSSTDNVTSDTTPTFTVGSCTNGLTVTLSGAALTGTGTCASNTVTITLSAISTDGTYPFVAFQSDDVGNDSTASSSLDVTIDTTDPVVSSFSPADGSATAPIDADLTIVFDGAISSVGTGTIVLRTADDAIVETVHVSTGSVTGSGTTTIVAALASDLEHSTDYYVTVSTGALFDLAGNAFAGFQGPTTWNFTTAAEPSAGTTGGGTGSSSDSAGGGGGGGRRGGAGNDRIVRALENKGRQREGSTGGNGDGPHEGVGERTPLAVTVGRVEITIDDVPSDSWFAPHVGAVIAGKLMEGYRDVDGNLTGDFGPADPVTLEQVAKVAVLLSSVNMAQCPLPPANDRSAQTWAAVYVSCAERKSWPAYADPSRDLNTPASRAEVVETLMLAFKRPLPNLDRKPFVDVPVDHPSAAAIAAAKKDGLVTGDTDAEGVPTGGFRPNGAVNRAEFAKIVDLAVRLYVKD